MSYGFRSKITKIVSNSLTITFPHLSLSFGVKLLLILINGRASHHKEDDLEVEAYDRLMIVYRKLKDYKNECPLQIVASKLTRTFIIPKQAN